MQATNHHFLCIFFGLFTFFFLSSFSLTILLSLSICFISIIRLLFIVWRIIGCSDRISIILTVRTTCIVLLYCPTSFSIDRIFESKPEQREEATSAFENKQWYTKYSNRNNLFDCKWTGKENEKTKKKQTHFVCWPETESGIHMKNVKFRFSCACLCVCVSQCECVLRIFYCYIPTIPCWLSVLSFPCLLLLHFVRVAGVVVAAIWKRNYPQSPLFIPIE